MATAKFDKLRQGEDTNTITHATMQEKLTQKRGKGAPTKPADEVVHKRVSIPLTQPEYEMLTAEVERLKETTPGVAFTETSVAKIGVIKYLKGIEK